MAHPYCHRLARGEQVPKVTLSVPNYLESRYRHKQAGVQAQLRPVGSDLVDARPTVLTVLKLSNPCRWVGQRTPDVQNPADRIENSADLHALLEQTLRRNARKQRPHPDGRKAIPDVHQSLRLRRATEDDPGHLTSTVGRRGLTYQATRGRRIQRSLDQRGCRRPALGLRVCQLQTGAQGITNPAQIRRVDAAGSSVDAGAVRHGRGECPAH